MPKKEEHSNQETTHTERARKRDTTEITHRHTTMRDTQARNAKGHTPGSKGKG
jgi:hypothetical protein